MIETEDGELPHKQYESSVPLVGCMTSLAILSWIAVRSLELISRCQNASFIVPNISKYENNNKGNNVG